MTLVTLLIRVKQIRNDDLQLRADGIVCFHKAVVHRVLACLHLLVQICTISQHCCLGCSKSHEETIVVT